MTQPNPIQLNSTHSSNSSNSTQFSPFQPNSSQVNTIQFYLILLNSTQFNLIQPNSPQCLSNSTQFNPIIRIQPISTQFNLIKQFDQIQSNITQFTPNSPLFTPFHLYSLQFTSIHPNSPKITTISS